MSRLCAYTDTHTLDLTHTHAHLSRTPGRVRSADHLRPSLQQADCLCHWRQPVTQRRRVRGCGDAASWSRALSSGAVCVGVCSLSTCHLHSFFIPLALLLGRVRAHKESHYGGRIAPHVCARSSGLPALTTAVPSEPRWCRRGENRLEIFKKRLACVWFLFFVVFFFMYIYIKLPFKAMDLR